MTHKRIELEPAPDHPDLCKRIDILMEVLCRALVKWYEQDYYLCMVLLLIYLLTPPLYVLATVWRVDKDPVIAPVLFKHVVLDVIA